MIQIPRDAKIISDARLTVIRAVGTLHDRHVKAPGGLVDQVKKAMKLKDAEYAQSDLVYARLQPGDRRGTIDPVKALAAFGSKNLPVEMFLLCVTMRKDPLKEFLSEREIESLTTFEPDPPPKLITEFKPAVTADSDARELAKLLQKALTRGD